MTTPRLSRDMGEHIGRMYARTRDGGPEVPSITNILDVQNQRLDWWEALCAAREAFRYAPNLARIHAAPEGRERWRQERDAIQWLKDSAARDRAECIERGDLVHDYAEAWALRQMGHIGDVEVAERERACERGGVSDYLEHFHAFWARYKPRPLLAEGTVWNHKTAYAGTTDLVCEINDLTVVADYKTKKALYQRGGRPKQSDLRSHTGMQLAAANNADEVWVPGAAEDGSGDRWEPWPYKAQAGIGVAIAPDGFRVRQYKIHHPVTWQTFTGLREAWEWWVHGDALMSPRVNGPEGLIDTTLLAENCDGSVGALV